MARIARSKRFHATQAQRRKGRRKSPHTLNATALLAAFASAPDFARFRDVELEPVVRKKRAWFERCRWAGNGIPYVRDGRNVFYVKKDVVAWLEAQQRCTSTSDYDAPRRSRSVTTRAMVDRASV